MTRNLSDLNEALYEQKYLFAFAALSMFTTNSIDNIIEYFESQGDKKGNLGLLKKSHKHYTLLESEMMESQLVYHVNFRESMKYFKEFPIKNIVYLNTLITGSILTVGDLLEKYELYGWKKRGQVIRESVSSEIELMRHIRNGVAHGNKFNFKDEPPFTASFNKLILSNLQVGIRVIPIGGDGYIEFGDILELYDTIISQIKHL